jgi:hypothetical protein
LFHDLFFQRGTTTQIPDTWKEFRREVKVLRDVSAAHPCIVRLVEALDSPQVLVFELCTCSLRDVFERGGLNP